MPFGRLVGTAIAVAASTLGATALDLPRTALRSVVDACATAKRTIGAAFPCLAVELGTADRAGFAIIRDPGRTTHVIVSPLAPVSGIEDPAVLTLGLGTLWTAAVSARRYVVAAAGPGLPIGAVGLAVNSERTRSQDHLHIHAECVRPEILDAIRVEAPRSAHDWRRMQRPVAGDHPYARRISLAEIERGNLFALLATMPGGRGLAGVAALAVEMPDPDDGFVLAGIRSARRSVEGYFDHACVAAKRAAGGAG